MTRMEFSFLEETLVAWRHVRAGVVDELKNIPPDKLDFRPTPEVRSVRELVQHILEVAMFHTAELSRPDTNLKRYPMSEWGRRYAATAYDATKKQDLVKLLRSQIKDAESAFRRMGDLALWQLIEQFDGSLVTKFQRVHDGIGQEMYHRGQLTTYARLMGREPALTKLIRRGD